MNNKTCSYGRSCKGHRTDKRCISIGGCGLGCLDNIEQLDKPQVSPSSLSDLLSAEKLAEKFHTKYEELAPAYKYETRKESAVPWKDVPENNKNLMIRVCREILQGI